MSVMVLVLSGEAAGQLDFGEWVSGVGAIPPRHHCGVTSIGFGRRPTRRPSGPATSIRRALSTWRLPLERQPAVVFGEAHIAGIDAEPHADAEADRNQHDIAAPHILGVEA